MEKRIAVEVKQMSVTKMNIADNLPAIHILFKCSNVENLKFGLQCEKLDCITKTEATYNS